MINEGMTAEVEFVDRSVALAAKAFVSFLPLLVLLTAVSPQNVRDEILCAPRPPTRCRDGMGSIPVIARLVCPDGSEEWWPAKATRRTATSVLIGFETEPGDHNSLR